MSGNGNNVAGANKDNDGNRPRCNDESEDEVEEEVASDEEPEQGNVAS